MPLILTAAQQLADATERISRTYAKELHRLLRDVEARVRRLVIESESGAVTPLIRATRAAALRKEIQQALIDAGYENLAAAASDISLNAVVTRVEALRKAAGVEVFAAADAVRIDALKELARQDVLGQGVEIAQAVWRTVAQGVFSARPVPDLLDDLADALDEELSTARTLYDTSVNIFARSLEALKASGEDDEAFAYMGPVDVKTRPFCYDLVGKVLTRAEIEDLDNGQLPNVFLTGGGYNCRHAWIALSQYSESRDLLGTDARIPEVAAQMQNLEEGDREAA